jgi:uncharacterized Zn finger protein
MIPPSTTRRFPSWMRQRGAAYHEEDRVRIHEIDAERVVATVEGTASYAVNMRRGERGGTRMSCACPYWDAHNVCKHLWATLLAADARGFFEPRGTGKLSAAAAGGRSPTKAAAP